MFPIRAIATSLMSGTERLEMVEGTIYAWVTFEDSHGDPIRGAVFALDDGRLFEVPIKNLTLAVREDGEEDV